MYPHQIVLYLFVIFFALHFLVESALSIINARHLKAHSDTIPEPLRGVYTPESHARSIEYALARARFGHVDRAFGALLTVGILLSDFIPLLNEGISRLELRDFTHQVVVLCAFTFAMSFVNLPLEIYATFRLEARFGFNKMTWRTFLLDKLKGVLLMLVLGVPFLYAVLALVSEGRPAGDGAGLLPESAKAYWWLFAGLFVIAFQFLMMILFPVFIAPLFNKFTPLAEGELNARLEELARRCGFAVRGILVMDGSRRSAHSNAFFTGVGKARRIVLYDTLIEQLSVPELAAVLAHEIGHYRKKHILKMLVLSSAMTLLGFYILSLLLYWHPLYQAFRMAIPNEAKGLILLSLITGSFTFWIGPFFNKLSRKHEYEADAYAREQTGDAAPMEAALLKLHAKNLSAPTPHPLYSAWHYSHPTLLERIRALRGGEGTTG